MHSKYTLDMLHLQTITLGQQLRKFETEVCPRYKTYETPKENAARVRTLVRRKQKRAATLGVVASGSSTSLPIAEGGVPIDDPHIGAESTKKELKFNLNTSKIHALGDYVSEIKAYGTTDSYSTQLVGAYNIQISGTM